MTSQQLQDIAHTLKNVENRFDETSWDHGYNVAHRQISVALAALFTKSGLEFDVDEFLAECASRTY